MIDQIAADMAGKLMAQLPYVKAVKYIARQDPTGIIVKEGPEEWVGVDDRNDGRLYIRFRDGWDGMFVEGRLTSAKNMSTIARLRAVYMHVYTNEHELARFLAYTILNCENHELRYAVRLRTWSTDKQFIVTQETKMEGKGIPDDNLRLIMVDFDVQYRDSLLLTPACVPEGIVC